MKRSARLTILLLGLLVAAAASAAVGLSPATYRQLTDIRERMDAGAYGESIRRLQKLERDSATADGYTRAVVRQYLGYAHLGRDDYAAARRAFQGALKLEALPAEVTGQLYRILAQLGLQLDKPKEAARYIGLWLQGRKSLKPEDRLLAAQAYYAAGKVKTAIGHLEKAVSAVAEPQESWLRSLLSMYLDARRYKQARRLLQRLIGRYPDKVLYWRHLAQLHMQLGREEKALAVLALAYEKGLLEAKELVRFAGLHAHAGMPEKAARLLRQWCESGRLRTTRKLLMTEADLWSLARERERALELLRRAHDRSKDGKPAFKEGQILFQDGRWPEAVAAFRRALQKGGLKETAQIQLLLGVAAYRCGELEQAAAALERAAAHGATAAQAQPWLSALRSEAGKGT
jgi:tetratricopeptide (TPR) repeat protein